MYLRRLPFQGQYTVFAVCDSRGNPILLDFFNELGPNFQKDLDAMLQLLEGALRVSENLNFKLYVIVVLMLKPDYDGLARGLSLASGLSPIDFSETRNAPLLEACAVSGPSRNTEISHKIQGEIWEFIKGRLRVLWFYDQGRVVICTHGFVKKTRKTPERELNRAENMCQEYLTAKNEDNIIIEEEKNGEENL